MHLLLDTHRTAHAHRGGARPFAAAVASMVGTAMSSAASTSTTSATAAGLGWSKWNGMKPTARHLGTAAT